MTLLVLNYVWVTSLGQPAPGSTSYLDVPSIQVSLPDSPLPSCTASPEPMSQGKPPQPAYVSDFTHMLAFMNQNHTQFQEQITRAISLLAGSHETTPAVQKSNGSSVKLCNP